MTVKVSLRSKTTLDDSFCPSYKLVYNAEWLAALGIPALLAIIMLTSQSASANMIGGFDCYGGWRCVSGWNHAISQAQTDWNSGQYNKIQDGGNPYCPTGHTQAYCNGYTKGYTYEWNTLYQGQPGQPTIPNGTSPQPQQCGLGQTIGNDGQCHLSIEGVKQACRDHPTACSIIQGLLLHALGL